MWKTSSGWQAERLAAVLLVILGLHGCAGPLPATPRDGQDIVTASDEGDLRRRARIRLELASTYYSQGQFTTALDELKQAIAIDPRLPAAHEMRALIYDAMGDAARADESFRQALVVDPNNGSVLHNNAWSLCRRGQYAAADALFARAAASPSGLGSKTLLARGVCLQRSGDLKAAEKTLLQAYELDPSSPATAFNLAAVLLKEGELERARFYIRRVNNVPAQVTAESLWLAARVEHRLGNLNGRDELAEQLRRRFTGTREATALELGRFDE
jgi:type IV pilus assembly protein PilF